MLDSHKMDLSAAVGKPRVAQSSIRNFFQPRAPTYTLPPSSNSAIQDSNKGKLLIPAIGPTSSPLPTVPVQVASNGTSTSTLPSQASISTVQEKHIQPLRRINSLLLCINYPDSFYHKILDPATSPNFSRVILWQDARDPEPKVIGGIVCRLDLDEVSQTSAIYIQSLALLAPYRSCGLATAALNRVIAASIATPPNDFPITSLYAHVWTENQDGLEWYAARGFTKEQPLIENYYRRLNPDTAWILRRRLLPCDHLMNSPPTSPQASLPPRAALSTSSAAASKRSASFQTVRPENEWNDLPEDILTPSSRNVSGPPSARNSPFASTQSLLLPSSGPSSRSSSMSRAPGAKKKRQYPAAAFGNGATS